MKRVAPPSRVLVFTAAFLLLVPNLRRSPGRSVPQGAAGQDTAAPQGEPGDCIYAIDQPNTPCPSGCTASSFTQWGAKPGTNGTDYLKAIGSAPCGTAKSGQQCNPPTLWNPQNDYANCCTALGSSGCTGNYNVTEYLACCNQSPVECVAGVCCLPNGQGCSGNNAYCCSGYCNPASNTCTPPGCPPTCPQPGCSNINGFCWAACDCPENEACSDCLAACESEMYEGCESVCEQCGVCCPPPGTYGKPIQGQS